MEIKEITAQYEIPKIKIIELSLGEYEICTVSATEILEEEDGEW